ncbi:MbtH family protein [Lentzea sp. NEAU-D13]|uniref:MbtH family protein n=1 Tax=Lentzea alba TaxID=2714351 RepID=A0A7C9VQT6_9PSEU|nr:MbtH family protein [Lentzea alba]NGY60652.1 MbtH family protein [Lentzea alba]
MTSPFAQAHTMFLVLVSPTGQYSIWPAVLQVPAGWQVVHGVASRISCEEHLAARRADLPTAA